MLHNGDLYWDTTVIKENHFPKVETNLKTQVLVIGGGMSGSLASYVLSNAGYEVTVIDRKTIGGGSSSANTGLLQYSSDMMLSELAKDIGEEQAVLFYTMCLDGMDSLTALNNNLELNTDYILRDSIFYASNRDDKQSLITEYEYLSKYDFPVKYLDNQELKSTYGIDKPCALRTWHDAEVNPYKFINALTHENKKSGVRYFENTSIDLDHIHEDFVLTKDGFKVEFEHIILATGYAKLYDVIKGKATIGRTYAFSSKPLTTTPWIDNVMVWETKNPYLYCRTTRDHRIIAGGLDEDMNTVEKDLNKINKKNTELLKKVQSIMGDIDIEIDCSWNALFGSSKDGMPFIGRDPLQDNKYYLLGYEGNGTCYSMSGAKIIKDLIENKENPYVELLRVDRKVK
ncbi:NAD(P)/FAD-dependent oxidoreductase [Paenibacillus sp. CMAA1364]